MQKEYEGLLGRPIWTDLIAVLIKLAIAGGAQAIVTHNVRDVARGELAWKELRH